VRCAREIAIADPATDRYRTVRVGPFPHRIWVNTHDPLPSAPRTASRDQR
jgi:hypothetical protein